MLWLKSTAEWPCSVNPGFVPHDLGVLIRATGWNEQFSHICRTIQWSTNQGLKKIPWNGRKDPMQQNVCKIPGFLFCTGESSLSAQDALLFVGFLSDTGNPLTKWKFIHCWPSHHWPRHPETWTGFQRSRRGHLGPSLGLGMRKRRSVNGDSQLVDDYPQNIG